MLISIEARGAVKQPLFRATFCVVLSSVCFLASIAVAQDRAVTFEDLMRFRQIKRPVLSDDGRWVAYETVPDRGDGAVIARSTRTDRQFEIALGSRPIIASNSSVVALRLEPSFSEKAAAEYRKEDAPLPGMAMLNLQTGSVDRFAAVDTFGISADGTWLARIEHPVPADSADDASKDKHGVLVLRHVSDLHEMRVEDVSEFAFSKEAASIAYAVASGDSVRTGLYARDLQLEPGHEVILDERPAGRYPAMAWMEEGATLAFLVAESDTSGALTAVAIRTWRGGVVDEIVTPADAPSGWILPAKNPLRWTKDGERLFFGYRPDPEPDPVPTDSLAARDPYNAEVLLEKREVDVWHWNDPRINPQQKMVWKAEQARTYAAVYHVAHDKIVPLSDSLVLMQGAPENGLAALGKAESPYFKERSWDGEYFDLYVVDLQSGAKKLVAEHLQDGVGLSPGGRFVVYYDYPHWHVRDVSEGTTRNLTHDLDVSFSDEDYDYPRDPPDYGIGGWIGSDDFVLINDKFDVWRFDLVGKSAPRRTTGGYGRQTGRTFRVLRTDKEKQFFGPDEPLLLTSYDNERKNWGFYRGHADRDTVEPLLEEDKLYRFLAKAEKADRYLFTKEDYNEFPDLWATDAAFDDARKVSDLGRQLDGFAWGASELVEWTSADGIPLQGVLIRPGNYEAGKRYPVIVYFYRLFSQKLHEFNEPVVNHRPSFPLYASNGYAVFLPDIRFEVGRPGFSATKAIVPGVQKLVDMGVADPKAIGLHGHSWSGYQTAFIVTQTDIFAAAVAGAPVSNMTSAYGGIRWESGLGRQFQYEKTQSRLGGSLWEARDRYIDNSPLFFADRIHTPLLLMFGDEDGAVPWYQGIELYLALRRLGKDAVFLQYRGEPHHLKKYPNKLDYSIKMKEYFDHYLKGETAAPWISDGVPYSGN